MPGYPFQDIESKWRKYWHEHKTFRVLEDPAVPKDRRVQTAVFEARPL